MLSFISSILENGDKKMINVIICDDIESDLKNTITIVDNYFKLKNIKYKKYIFNDYNSKFKEIIKQKLPFKLYILDIETPSRSGIDIAREIRQKDIDSVIIFLTGHEELGSIVLKNDLLFLGFINKFDNCEERLVNCLNKSLDILNKPQILKVLDRNIIYTIKLNDILYFTKDSFERKTIIHTDYDEYKVNNTLTEIISMVDDRFVQTHRACFVNKTRVTKIDKHNKIIKFDNGEDITLVSDKYKKELV